MNKYALIRNSIAGATALLPIVTYAGPTLDTVKERGVLNCGVSTGTSIGKSTLDDSGN